MCGIFGFSSRSSLAGAEETLRAMGRTLAHRGPDANGQLLLRQGTLGMGFVRLSIIDLTPAGNQPMADESGDYVITFNGEIFNYLEVRAELQQRGHAFRSQSDTEVALRAYMEWGTACFAKFRGMWGLVIQDRRRDILVASRDYFGIKPLYFFDAGDTLYWASEIKAFRATGRPLEENLAMSLDYLLYGLLDHTEQTLFKKVWQLRPGELAIVHADRHVEKSFYWDLLEAARAIELPRKTQDCVAEFRSRLVDTMRISQRSDVPVWILLSGGIDSSALVGMAAHLRGKEPVNALTVVHDEASINEVAYAEQAAAFSGARLHKIWIMQDEWCQNLTNMVQQQDEPCCSTTFVNHWFLMRKLHEMGIKVILSGQGVDEVMYGYVPLFMGHYFADLLSRGRLLKLVEEVFWHWNVLQEDYGMSARQILPHMLKGLLPPAFAKIMKARLFSHAAQFVQAGAVPAGLRSSYRFEGIRDFDRLHNAFYRYLKADAIPIILHYEDRNSMGFSIEQRVPYLDRDVVSYAFALPSHMSMQRGRSKWAFREACKDFLPASIYNRTSKLGFSTPEHRWVHGAPFQDFLRDHQIADVLQNSIVDWNAFSAAFQRGHRRDRYDPVFWRVFNYGLWKKLNKL
jgi:asparagine synthase (glutamine-hydrolysing)